MKKGQTRRQESWDWMGCAHCDGGQCLLCRAGEAGVGPALSGDLCEQAKYVPIASAATRCFVSLGGGICPCQFLHSVVS